MTLVRRLAAPPAVTWEWLNDPDKRRRWEDLVVEPRSLPGGRSGVGEVTYCLRGSDVRVMTVLDWRPFDYFTVQSTSPPSAEATLASYALKAVDDLTELQVTVALPDKGLKRRRARQSTETSLGRSLDRLAEAIAGQLPVETPATPGKVTAGSPD